MLEVLSTAMSNECAVPDAPCHLKGRKHMWVSGNGVTPQLTYLDGKDYSKQFIL